MALLVEINWKLATFVQSIRRYKTLSSWVVSSVVIQYLHSQSPHRVQALFPLIFPLPRDKVGGVKTSWVPIERGKCLLKKSPLLRSPHNTFFLRLSLLSFDSQLNRKASFHLPSYILLQRIFFCDDVSHIIKFVREI